MRRWAQAAAATSNQIMAPRNLAREQPERADRLLAIDLVGTLGRETEGPRARAAEGAAAGGGELFDLC